MVFTCQLESYFHENLPYTNFIFNDSKQAYIYVTINATQIVVDDYTFKLLLLSCDMHHIYISLLIVVYIHVDEEDFFCSSSKHFGHCE